MVNILFFTERNPESVFNGYSLRTLNICKKLKERNNKIYLLYIDSIQSHNNTEIFSKMLQIDIPNLYTAGYILKLGIGISSLNLIHKKLIKIIKEFKIDVIHVQGHLAGLITLNFLSKPKILDLTDSQILYYHRQLQITKSLNGKLKNYGLLFWWKYIENKLLNNFYITTVVSPKDAEVLKKLNKLSNIEIIPNGVDTNYFKPLKINTLNKPTILFHGSMNFKPNIDTANYIYNEIFPLIKEKIPDVHFFIVGRNPTNQIKKMDNRNDIIVTGEIKDIRKYLARTNVVVVPMQSGGGFKNKILEAMAMAKPVITNNIGSEAFDYKTRHCLVIGKNKYEIADKIVELLKSKDLMEKIGYLSRNHVIDCYNWTDTAIAYEKLYQKLIKNFDLIENHNLI